MFRKSLSILLCILMLLTLFPIEVLAADIQQNLPINDGMESAVNVNQSILSSTGLSNKASLTEDRIEGKYAVKIAVDDIVNQDQITYNLTTSENFDAKKYSKIKLWVKPGPGAKWVKFFSAGSVILSDIDGDGQYKVGQDLIIGKWNEVTLNLVKMNPSGTTGKDLTVTTNEYSTWTFDDVESLYSPTWSIDLTQMVNSETELKNNQLQFKSNGVGGYKTTPTILVSQKSLDYNKTDTTQADFQQGTLTNVTATSAGNLELLNSLSGNRVSPVFDISSPGKVTSSQIVWNQTNTAGPSGTFSRNSIAYKEDATQFSVNQLRYDAGKYGQGVIIENGTSNLLTNNQSSIETDTTGFMDRYVEFSQSNVHSRHGQNSLKTYWNNGSSSTSNVYLRVTGLTLNPNTAYTWSTWVYAESDVYLDTSLMYLREGGGAQRTIAPAGSGFTLIKGGTWTKLSGSGTIPADWFQYGSSELYLRTPEDQTNGNNVTTPVWYDMLQVEAQQNPTSWITGGSSRVAENLSVPTSVLNPNEGSIEGWFNLNTVSSTSFSPIVTTGSSNPRLLIMRDPASGKLKIWENNASGSLNLNSSTTIDPKKWYHFAYTWSPTLGRALYINGVKEANSSSYLQPIGIGTDNLLNIGSWNGSYANGVIDDIRISIKARTDSEIKNGYSSGAPLLDDEITSLKMNFDNNIQSVTGTSVRVETNISLDGGNTWQGWVQPRNGDPISGLNANTDLTNARLQYKTTLSSLSSSSTPKLNDVTIKITGQDSMSTPNQSIPEGKISNIYVDSTYVGSGPITELPTQRNLISTQPTKMVTSGDGRMVYYSNPSDAGKLYVYDLSTGEFGKVTDYVPVNLKSDYDGDRVAFKDSSNNLYVYNGTGAQATILLSGNVGSYGIADDGTIYYHNTSTSSIYSVNKTTNSIATLYSGQALSYLDVTKNAPTYLNGVYYHDIYFSNGTQLLSLKRTPAGWKTALLTTLSATIDGVWTTDNGDIVVVKSGGSFYSYQVSSKALRKLDLTATTIVRVTSDNSLIVQDSNYNYLMYNMDSDTTKDIRPTNAKNPAISTDVYFDVNKSADRMVYVSTSGLAVYDFNGISRPERYLLSFDGKNSWYSYKNKVWEQVKAGGTPATADFDKYGMTIDEINSLTEADYADLYADGGQIYSFDVAVYFASVSPSITPSLKGITVTLTGNETNGEELLEKALYISKEQQFDPSNWRKIRKIYPVEICPKEAEVYYFTVKDSVYYSLKGGTLTPLENQQLLDGASLESNWIDGVNEKGISQLGVTAEELRALSESTLNNLLPSSSLSIVYVMKVKDTSTEGYSSIINIDYVEGQFSDKGEQVTLKISQTSGSVTTYELSKDSAEAFMEWVYGRQFNKGPIIYRLKTATQDVFINYYTIESVDVL